MRGSPPLRYHVLKCVSMKRSIHGSVGQYEAVPQLGEEERGRFLGGALAVLAHGGRRVTVGVGLVFQRLGRHDFTRSISRPSVARRASSEGPAGSTRSVVMPLAR